MADVVRQPLFTESETLALRASFGEHELVRLRRPVLSHEGEFPQGSLGTVIAVWASGEAYEVEFDSPFQAVVTLMAKDIVPVENAS